MSVLPSPQPDGTPAPRPERDPQPGAPEDRVRSSRLPYEPLPAPRRLAHIRRLLVRGRGRIVLELHGTGRVTVSRGRFDDFCFEGRGVPKHVSAQRVYLDCAAGRLVLEGDHLELEFRGGTADAELAGTFDLEEPGEPSRRSLMSRRAA